MVWRRSLCWHDERPEQMRILAIPSSSYVFGMENMILAFLEGLVPEVTCHCLLTRWSDGAFARRLDALGIPYTTSWLGTLSRQFTWQALSWTADCLRRLPTLYADYLSLVRRFRPDAIYLSSYKQIQLLWPLLCALPIPVLCHMADPPPDIPFQRRSFALWNRAVDHYIVISESVRERLARLGTTPERMSLLYPGIDLKRFPLEPTRNAHFLTQFGWPDNALIVGMTGQQICAKGHADLIDAMQLVQVRLPHVRLVLGGPEKGPYATALRARAKATRLDEALAFAGWLPEAREFYAAVDVYVIPSRQAEGFGQVAAEAMATGRPVIGTRSGAVPEVVAHGVTGLVVEPGRVGALASALLLLADQPALRTSMGHAGRERVVRHFDLVQQTCGLIEIFAAITSRKSALNADRHHR